MDKLKIMDNLNIINYMSTYSIGKMKIKMQNKTYIQQKLTEPKENQSNKKSGLDFNKFNN